MSKNVNITSLESRELSVQHARAVTLQIEVVKKCEVSIVVDTNNASPGPSVNNSPSNIESVPNSSKAMLSAYAWSVHIPNMAMETAKGITSTLIPLLVRELIKNKDISDNTRAGRDVDNEDASDTFMGIMLAAIGLGTTISNMPVGVLIRKFNLSDVAASGGIIYIIATSFFILFIGSILWYQYLQPYDEDGFPATIGQVPYRLFQFLLVVTAICWGGAFSCLSITRLLFVQNRVPKTFRARLMSLVGGAQRWAMVIGPFLAGLVAQHFGIFVAFALHLPLGAANAYCLYRSETFRDISDEIQAEDQKQSPRKQRDPKAKQSEQGGGDHAGEERRAVPASLVGLDSADPASTSKNESSSPVKNSSFAAVNGLKKGLSASVSAGNEDIRRSAAIADPLPSNASMIRDPTAADLKGGSTTVVVPIEAAKPAEVAVEEDLPDLHKAVRRHWKLLISIGSFAFLMMFLRSCRNVLLTVNALDLNLSASAVGFVLSLSYFLDATLFFLGGYLSDRYGPERVAILASGMLGLSFLALGIPVAASDVVIEDPNNIPLSYYFTPPVMKLLIVGVLFGIANSVGSGLVLALVANHAPKSKGNTILSLLRTCQDAGPLVGPLLAGFSLDIIRFNGTSFAFGIIGISNAVSALLFLPKPDVGKKIGKK